MGRRWEIRLSNKAANMMYNHIEFIGRVSRSAALKLEYDFVSAYQGIENDAERFPVDELVTQKEQAYRKCLFGKDLRYKMLFCIENNKVYIDAICDCRQNNEGIELNH